MMVGFYGKGLNITNGKGNNFGFSERAVAATCNFEPFQQHTRYGHSRQKA
jgi:hypothetical protein